MFLFVKETRGGTGTFLNQISLINTKQLKIVYFFYKNDEYFKSKIPKIIINSNYPTNEYLSFDKLIIFLINLIKTYKIIFSQKPNYLYACDLYSFFQLSIVKILLLTRKVHFFYYLNIDIIKIINNKLGFFYRFSLNLLYRSLLLFTKPTIIFPSKSLANHLIKKLFLSKKQIKIIPYGVNISEINILANKEMSNIDKKIFKIKCLLNIISIGRFCQQKDFATILKAFSIISNKFKNIRLILIGDGNMKKKLIELSKTLGIEKRVFFLGWKTNIFPYLKYSDIFVFSSLFEGFGITILEAMAMKLPVVATNTQYGPSEILENGKYGILVPVSNYQNMAYELLRLIKNNKLREKYSRLSYQRAKKYDLNSLLKKHKKTILNIN
jgi:glycosyltransferase involved in cell wall biosynthesis